MATNFRVKIGKIGLFTFIRSAGISKRIAISPFRLMKVCLGDLATPCVNMVNFSPLTPEFTKVKDMPPSFLFYNKPFRQIISDFHQMFTMW